MMTKSEKGRALRQSILRLLNRHGGMGLNDLAVQLSEPRQVVLGHLNMMLHATGGCEVYTSTYAGEKPVYHAMVRKTKVFVHGGAVRDPLKPSVVNRCMHKAPIKNQCAGSTGPGPRQSTAAKLFGL